MLNRDPVWSQHYLPMLSLDADVNLGSLVGRDALVDLVTELACQHEQRTRNRELVSDQGTIRVIGIALGLPFSHELAAADHEASLGIGGVAFLDDFDFHSE